jgi:hypothetical protein
MARGSMRDRECSSLQVPLPWPACKLKLSKTPQTQLMRLQPHLLHHNVFCRLYPRTITTPAAGCSSIRRTWLPIRGPDFVIRQSVSPWPQAFILVFRSSATEHASTHYYLRAADQDFCDIEAPQYCTSRRLRHSPGTMCRS